MQPVWGFYKKEAMAAGATAANIGEFAHKGTSGIFSAVLATFAIAPWAFVGFDTIPQAAEEFKFSYKKVMLIMGVAIAFGCFVYTSNNAVAAAALENWPERVMAGGVGAPDRGRGNARHFRQGAYRHRRLLRRPVRYNGLIPRFQPTYLLHEP